MGFELELTVTISYNGPKASIDTPEDANVAIRGDLTALGIPHPKRSNVSVVYPGTVRFYWIAAPHSAIRKKLTGSLQPPHNMEQEKIFKERFITRIDLKESKAKPGSSQAPSKPNSQSHDNQKTHPETPVHPPPQPFQYLGNPDASFNAIPMSGYSPEVTLPPRPSEKGKEKDDGNGVMENGVAPPFFWPQRPHSTLIAGAAVKVKPEPTDVPIPTAWNYHSSDKAEPMGDVDMPPIRVVGSWHSSEWERVRSPEAEPRDGDKWSDTRPLWTSKRRSPNPRYGAEMDPSMRRYPLSVADRTTPRYPETDYERHYDRRPYPKPQLLYNQYQNHHHSPLPTGPVSKEKNMLRSELADARRKLNAEIKRERDVVQRLRDLGEGEEVVEGYNDNDDFVTRARIQQIEEELQAERVRRKELERIVEDIRRECRTPFVVPAILEAFLQVSELTNDVLEGTSMYVDGDGHGGESDV